MVDLCRMVVDWSVMIRTIAFSFLKIEFVNNIVPLKPKGKDSVWFRIKRQQSMFQHSLEDEPDIFPSPPKRPKQSGNWCINNIRYTLSNGNYHTLHISWNKKNAFLIGFQAIFFYINFSYWTFSLRYKPKYTDLYFSRTFSEEGCKNHFHSPLS